MVAFNPYSIPLSLNQLNINLEASLKKKDFSLLGLPFDDSSKDSDLKKILNNITWPILSYEDVNKENRQKLFQILFEYFRPDQLSKEHQKIFREFKNRIEKNPIKQNNEYIVYEFNPHDNQSFTTELTVEQLIDSFANNSLSCPDFRLKTAFLFVKEPFWEDKYKQGRFYQVLLNFLVLEQLLFRINASETEYGFISQCVYNRLIADQKIKRIRLSSTTEAIVADVSKEMECLEPEELAFCIRAQRIKKTATDLIELKKIHQIFFEMIQKSSNPHFHSLVKCFWNEQLLMYLRSLFLKMKDKLKSAYLKYLFSDLRQLHKNYEEIKHVIVPHLSILLSILSNNYKQQIDANKDNDIIEEFDLETYGYKNRLNLLWIKSREEQKKMFLFTYEKLQNLIALQSKKEKKSFLEFKKNLFTDFNEISLILAFDPKNIEAIFTQQNGNQELLEIVNLLKLESSKKVSLSDEIAIQNDKGDKDLNIHEERQNDNNALTPVEPETKKPFNEKYVVDWNQKEEKLAFGWLKQEIFPYQYAKRVERWHLHSLGEPLPEDCFPDYYSKPLEYQKKMHIFHRLSPSINYFLHYGIQEKATLNGEERLFVKLPSYLEYDQKTFKGIITYGINLSQRICYHKFFSEKIESNSDYLKEIFKKSFETIEYPDLQQSQSTLLHKKIEKVSPSEEVNINPIWGITTFTNQKENVSIKIINATSFLE